ncbi:MAG TPA: VWA domain-containing protein [Pyrinomonadaceae bacterium]|jgi:Ca-activated chloride channel family protein
MKRLPRLILQSAGLPSLALILITLNASASLAQQTQETLTQTSLARRDAGAVVMTVTVTDRQRNYVKGLTQTNFTISDGKQEQQIHAFSASDAPLSVGILVDMSASVSKESLKLIRDVLSRFFQQSNNANEYFLMSFGTQPQLLQDWTTDTESLLKRIKAPISKGATALYDACYLSVGKVGRGQHRKRVLILISDGQDNTSRYSFLELKRALEESDVLLYSVGILGGNDPGSSLGMEGRGILEELASATGGAAFFPEDAKQSHTAFDTMAVELRNQYSIGFIPTANDKKRHSLKVRVTPPLNAPREMQKLNVRSRKNFYAKASQP